MSAVFSHFKVSESQLTNSTHLVLSLSNLKLNIALYYENIQKSAALNFSNKGNNWKMITYERVCEYEYIL